MTCRLKLTTPDGRHMWKDEEIQTNGTILITLEESMLLAVGICKAELNVYELASEKLLSTMPFDLIVIGSVYDNSIIESTNEFDALNTLLFAAHGLFETLKEHINNFLNPHKVTKAQVGLGNADNTHDIDKNVNSAKKLTTARNINGTSFDGTTDITTDKWGKSRTVKLSGDVSASKSVDGSTDVDIVVEVKDNSHKHIVSNISDLTATADELNVLDGITATTTELNYTDGVTSNIQTQIDTKAPKASPTFTDTPKAPTATAGTNTTQIATTAFAQTAVSNHNTSSIAHSDIRDLITGLTTRLNALADSDDTTLDQLSEIVAYIKNNKSLIDSVTTNKVNVSDIINNLTSTATNKPLAAKQGKILKDLIDTLNNECIKDILCDIEFEYIPDMKSDSTESIYTKEYKLSYQKGDGTTEDICTIRTKDSTYTNATFDKSGLMSYQDKIKLTGIADKATKNSASTTTPKAAGTASAGTEDAYARGDHIHPLQTTVSGNAGSATKLKTAININGMSIDGSANRVNYGTCSTDADIAAKVVVCTGFGLVTGAEITVKFTVTNTAANPTLNVNSTGDKPIYYRGAAISAGYLAKNCTYSFRYNGTQYELVSDINTNTTYSVATQSKNGLMSADDKKKLDGISDEVNTYSLPLATASERGGVKIGYTANGKNYPVQLSNEQMFVNVPWTDNDTTYSAGAQLALSGTIFKLKDVCTAITDWNNATTNGWYMGNKAANGPVSAYFYGLVIAHSVNYVRQILYRLAIDSNVSGTNCDRYERVCHGGTWGDWKNTSVHKAVPSDAVFTDTTYGNMTAATADAAGKAGLVPAPAAGAQSKYLRADGTWNTPTNTNNAVTQTISSTNNADYRVLFSATADDTTRTEGARKDTDFTYNPSTNTLTAGKVNADAADSTVDFTSGDDNNPTDWTNTGLFAAKEKLSSVIRRVSLMNKNMKYLYKLLGDNDISALGDGTVTGAIATLSNSLKNATDGIAFRYYTGSTTLTNLLNSLSAPCICITSTEHITDKPTNKYGVIMIFKQSDNRTGAICLCTDGSLMHNTWNSSTSALNGWK